MGVSEFGRFNIAVKPIGDSSDYTELLDGRGQMQLPALATFSNDDLRIEIEITAVDGVPGCRRYQVETTDGSPLDGMVTNVMRGLPLRNFLSYACAVMWIPTDKYQGPLPSLESDFIEALRSATRRPRRPLSDDRLQDFAEQYRANFSPGQMEEFARSLNYSERQVYRLKKQAVDRGFLEDGE